MTTTSPWWARSCLLPVSLVSNKSRSQRTPKRSWYRRKIRQSFQLRDVFYIWGWAARHKSGGFSQPRFHTPLHDFSPFSRIRVGSSRSAKEMPALCLRDCCRQHAQCTENEEPISLCWIEIHQAIERSFEREWLNQICIFKSMILIWHPLCMVSKKWYKWT